MKTGKTAKTAAGAGLAAVAVVGALHMPFARPLLMRLGGCPVGKASAAQIERARVQAVTATRGDGVAKARPAIGFALDASTPVDVLAWAQKSGVTCVEKREGLFLACKKVPLAAFADRASEPGVADDVSFAFRPSDRTLVNVTVAWYGLPADLAAARAASASARIEGEVGKASAWSGAATAEHLASGTYATASASWRFADYQADVTATSFGARGVALREHYVSGLD